MNWIIAHWAILAPIATILLSTVVTKLSTYPANTPQNELVGLLKILQMLMDRVSVMPHAGTEPHFKVAGVGLNVPLMRSRKPGAKAPATSPVATALVLILATSLLAGCCILKGTCKEGSAGACATDSVKQQFPHLLPAIADIFMHKGFDADVKAELASEGISVAEDILKCVVQGMFGHTEMQLAAAKSGKPMAGEPWFPHDNMQKLNDASRAWLKKHGGK